MFMPKEILYEENITNYKLGQELLEKYKDVPKMIIDNHNNIYWILQEIMQHLSMEKQALWILIIKEKQDL